MKQIKTKKDPRTKSHVENYITVIKSIGLLVNKTRGARDESRGRLKGERRLRWGEMRKRKKTESENELQE